MPVQDIVIRYQVDTSDLQRSEAILRNNARAAGLSEDEVSNYNKEIKRTGTQYRALIAQANKLDKALEEATDPDEVKKYNRELEKTQQELRDIEKQAAKSGKSLDFSKIGRNAGTSAGGIGKLSGGLSGLASTAARFAGPVAAVGAIVLGIGKPAVESANRYEQLQVAFETFLGSAEEAQKVLADLNQFSLQTPFTPDQVQEAGKALLAFGEDQETLIPTLQKIGDIASGTGKDYNELAIIYGKARVAGTLYAEDINQLVEAGVPIIGEFAEILGTTPDQVKRLASEGQISFGDLQTAFTNLTSEGGKFFGLIDAQSQTLSGRISTLQGRFAELSKGLGQGLAPVVGSVVDFLNGLLSRIDELDEVTEEFSAAFDPLIEAFESLLDVLGAAGNDIDFVGGVLKVLEVDIKVFGTVIEFGIIKPLTFAINLLRGFVTVGQAVGATFRFIRDNISQLGTAIRNLSFSGITDFFNGIRQAFGQSLNESELEASFTRTLRNLEETIDGIDKSNLQEKGKEVLTAINRGLEEGLITEARARELSQRLADRVREINKPLETIETEAPIEITPTVSDSELRKLEREKERIQKEAEKLQADVIKLQFQIELAAAGGSGTFAGLDLQEAEQIRQLESQAAFIELKRQNEELAEQGILNIRNEFGERRKTLAEKLAKEELATQKDSLANTLDEINRELLANEVQAQSIQILNLSELQEKFNQGLISAQEFQDSITEIEQNAAGAREQSALSALIRANEARRALITQTENEISQIEGRGAAERTEIENARLEALRAQRQTLADETLRTDQQINDARIAQNQAANEEILKNEQATVEARRELATSLLSQAQDITGEIASFVENQKQRELAAAENNEAEQERIRQRAARREKALAIAQALIGASLSIIRVLSNRTTLPEPFGSIQKIASAVAIGAAALRAVNQIRSVGFAEGAREVKPANRRKVRGKRKGTKRTDDIPAIIHGRHGERELVRIDEGERITPAAINKKFFADLNAIEDGAFKPGSIAEAAKMKPATFEKVIKTGGVILKPIAVPSAPMIKIDSTQRQVNEIDYRKMGKFVADAIENKKWEKGSTFWRELNNLENRLPKMIALEVAKVMKK